MMIETGWLTTQHVPLWAFLLALLTRPAAWARQAKDAVSQVFKQ